MRAGIAAVAWLAAAAAAPASAAPFVDPLDAPSAPTALAPRRLLTAVTAAGPRLVAVGQRGHVVASDDGGATWAQASVPVSTDLTAVWFTSPERGFAAGHDGVVLATEDGGRTWTRRLDARSLPASPDGRAGSASLLDVWFADARTGFAVGAFDLLLATEDGGATWTRWAGRTDNPRGLHLYAIRRAAGEVWIVGEQGLVLRLDPARGRFVAVPVPYRGSLFGVLAAGPDVIAFGLRGHAFRSRDRGATWERVATGVDETLTGGTTLPDGRVVLVTAAGRVLASDDGGATFRPASGGAASPAAGVAAAGPGAVAVVGAAGVRIERLR
jgi:photosystem II stability/assembly factor-like uncharacterized protein